MRVVVIGAGNVGSTVARRLADAHEVTVVDADPARTEALADALGVATVTGDGRSLDVLSEAEIGEADVVVASTDTDAANIMICGATKNAGEAFTLARVQRVALFETWQEFGGAFDVDLLLSVDLLTAQKIARAVTLPGARVADTFAGGIVEVAEFDVEPGGPLTGQRVSEASQFPSFTLAALFRDGEMAVPSRDTTLAAGDRVVVIGSPTSVRRFGGTIAPDASLGPDHDVVILGGGEVGTLTAAQFADQGLTPRIIERDADRVAEIETRVPDASVTTGEVTDMATLTDAGVGEADLVVAAIDDETNYLALLLATRLGAAHTAAVVDERDHVGLFDAAGVDMTVDPRSIVAEELTEVVLAGDTDDVALFEGDSAEVIEIAVDSHSILAGTTIRDARRDLPETFVIGAIVRGGTLHTPRGGTIVQTGDHVIAFVAADDVDSVAAKL